jgi:hypothetical protein
MGETRILITLRLYFPRNWEFGSALSKFRNFGGRGVFESPKPLPPRYTTGVGDKDACSFTTGVHISFLVTNGDIITYTFVREDLLIWILCQPSHKTQFEDHNIDK